MARNLSLPSAFQARRTKFIFFAFVAFAAACTSAAGQSQSPVPLTPEQVQRLLGSNSEQFGDSESKNETTLQPANSPPRRQFALSQIEKAFSARAGMPLQQFGYDQLGVGRAVTIPQMGALQDDYVLGPGDQIVVSLRGQDNSEYRADVDRGGQILLPRLSPIAASGRTFGEFKADLLAAIHRAYVATDAFVSVGKLRQISVLVIGEVANPGTRILTGQSTPLDAILLSDGITKAGSLRQLKLIRNGHTISIDLYSVLTQHGVANNTHLADGDRIVVPPIGATVAIAGDVRRPGIYELAPGFAAIGARELVTLGAGPEIRGAYRKSVLRIRPDGKQELVDTSRSASGAIRDGEILFVNKSVNIAIGNVSLKGAVRLPGQYPLNRAHALHDLLNSPEAFAPAPYMLLGLIDRIDPNTLQRQVLAFSPIHVLEGKENMNLISGDVVYVFYPAEIRRFLDPSSNTNLSHGSFANQHGDVQAVQNSSFKTSEQSGAALQSSDPITPRNTAEAAASLEQVSPSSETPTGDSDDGNPQAQRGLASLIETLSQTDFDYFQRVVSDYRVRIDGALRIPGPYLVAPGTTLAELVAAAGGLDADADTSTLEITSIDFDIAAGQSRTERKTIRVAPTAYETVSLQPRDEINIHKIFSDQEQGEIKISGEVRYPGTYTFLRGERVSQLLARAGGLTDVAYPYGTVYLRDSLAKTEQAGNEHIASELEQQLLGGTLSSTGPSRTQNVDPGTLAGLQNLIQEVRSRKAIGRLSIVADPSILAVNPDRDPMLEAGDTIYIPQRPSTVSVLGDVNNPGNYPYTSKASAQDYIDEAGGYDQNAMESMTYIVMPDGMARRVSRSWISLNSDAIPPGSVIFVPRDLFPVDWLSLTSALGSVIQSFAVTAASLSIIAKN